MSDRTMRLAMNVLALLGLGIAGYLTYTHYAGVSPVCALGHGCETVQHSTYARLAGIPVALAGLIGYLTILGCLLAPSSEKTRLAGCGLALGGFGFSMYLTYRELFTIDAVCQWCVASAAIMTALAGLAVARFLHGGDAAIARAPGGRQAK
jgi:uncharacterized membrane protein